MTQDPLHRLIRHLTEEEHRGVLRWLRGRGGSKHALALYKAMRKEPQWDKESNLAYAESMAWNTRHLAVEKNNLYARLLKHLRRRGDGKYAIKGIYESLHDFYLLRDRGMMSLALKSLRKAGELARKSDHLELQAWISYQECLALRQSEDHEAGALEKATADYAAVTKTLATNFELLRGFNSYFSEANRYNPDVQDPKLQAFIQRFAQPFENNPRLEYDRLVFFNRLEAKHPSLVPFDIIYSLQFFESDAFHSADFKFLLHVEHVGTIDKLIRSERRREAEEAILNFGVKMSLNNFPIDIFQRFSALRFYFYLNNRSKEEIGAVIGNWEKELRYKIHLFEAIAVHSANITTYYFLCNDWVKVARWIDNYKFYFSKSKYANIEVKLKLQFFSLIRLLELGIKIIDNNHLKEINQSIQELTEDAESPLVKLLQMICKIQPGKSPGNQQVYSEIIDLYHANNNLKTSLIRFIEIYIWASAKVHGRDTYEEYYRLRDESD